VIYLCWSSTIIYQFIFVVQHCRWLYLCCTRWQVILSMLYNIAGDFVFVVQHCRWLYLCCTTWQVILSMLYNMAGDFIYVVQHCRWLYLCCTTLQVTLSLLFNIAGDCPNGFMRVNDFTPCGKSESTILFDLYTKWIVMNERCFPPPPPPACSSQHGVPRPRDCATWKNTI